MAPVRMPAKRRVVFVFSVMTAPVCAVVGGVLTFGGSAFGSLRIRFKDSARRLER